jgi:hypothetical protein
MQGLRLGCILATLWFALLVSPSDASACSPSFERPTIRALGPAQLVVVGTVGDRVPGGRLFHVERWFNGGEPGTPIVIGFKEGEPIGDCSYPVSTGERKIIAPSREPGGRLYADLVTLQADPASPEGKLYLDEAIALFGPGVVPPPVELEAATPAPSEPAVGPESATDALSPLLIVLVGLALSGVIIGLVLRRRAFRSRST